MTLKQQYSNFKLFSLFLPTYRNVQMRNVIEPSVQAQKVRVQTVRIRNILKRNVLSRNVSMLGSFSVENKKNINANHTSVKCWVQTPERVIYWCRRLGAKFIDAKHPGATRSSAKRPGGFIAIKHLYIFSGSSFTVKREATPYFLKTPTNITVQEGELAVLKCHIARLGPKMVNVVGYVLSCVLSLFLSLQLFQCRNFIICLINYFLICIK